MVLLSRFEPCGNKVDIPLRRSNTRRGLLLKGVQHVDGLVEPDRVDSPVRIPVMRFDDLQDTRAEALPRSRRWCSGTELSDAQRVAHLLLDWSRDDAAHSELVCLKPQLVDGSLPQATIVLERLDGDIDPDAVAELEAVNDGPGGSRDANGDAFNPVGVEAKRVPNGLVCLLTALRFHGFATQHPR